MRLNAGTKGLKLPAKITSLLTLIWKLRSCLGELKPDFTISFGDQNNIITTLALLGTNLSIIVSERIYPPEGPLLAAVKGSTLKFLVEKARNLLYLRAQCVVVPCAQMVGYFSHSNVTTIENPVETPNISAMATQSDKIILGVGRLVKQKRFDLLIESFATISKDHPDWKLRIVGDGPLQPL